MIKMGNMQNLQISYNNYTHNKPTPKTICRDKLSISSVWQKKPKYKLCMKNRDERNTSLFLTTTTQDNTSVYPIHCFLDNSDLEECKQPLSQRNYIYFSANNDIWTHIWYSAYNEYLESAKLVIIWKIKHSKFTEIENTIRKNSRCKTNLQNYLTNHIDEIIPKSITIQDKKENIKAFIWKFF